MNKTIKNKRAEIRNARDKKKKIFEKIQWLDGGPNDKGIVIGYELGESEKQLRKKFKINHGFISFLEISKAEYELRKKEAQQNLKMFKI